MPKWKQRIRLLTLGHSYTVGANRRLAHEMAIIGQGRWEVVVAAPNYYHGNDLRPVYLNLGTEPCRVVGVDAYLTRYVHFFQYGPKLRTLLAENWDVVHCWEEPYILAGGQLASWVRRCSALVYRTAQNSSKNYPQPFRWIERYAMNRAAGWICSGQLVEATLKERPGYQRPMARIPLGVDLARFIPNPKAGQKVLSQLGWKPGPPVVGFLGRFVSAKGVEFLTRVLNRVPGDWRALFVGTGPFEPELRNWAARHGDRTRICTNVHHDDVPNYLNAMTVLAAPSQTTRNWKEQFGRMVIEAFACGIPVIGSSSGEIPYVIQDAGVIAQEDDEEVWARDIVELLADPGRRVALAQAGLERAQTEFAWPVVARMHLDFFERLLSEGRER